MANEAGEAELPAPHSIRVVEQVANEIVHRMKVIGWMINYNINYNEEGTIRNSTSLSKSLALGLMSTQNLKSTAVGQT